MNKIHPNKTTVQLVDFIQTIFHREKLNKALVAVSGGVDSATSFLLTVKALGANCVYPVLLPYGALSRQASADAQLLISTVSIPKQNILTINIQPAVDAVSSWDPSIDEGRRGNIMARMRMVMLYDLVKKHQALVVGTENKTEHLLGYYTRYGDEASDIEPLRHLYKTQIYQLARYINVPRKILQKAPSAGLWSGQTDEGEFGFTYQEVDKILSLHFDDQISCKALERRGFQKSLLDRVWYWIEKGQQKERLPVVASKPRVVLS